MLDFILVSHGEFDRLSWEVCSFLSGSKWGRVDLGERGVGGAKNEVGN